LYSTELENPAWLCRAASSRRITDLLGYLNYDNLLSSRLLGTKRFLRNSGIDPSEFVDPPESLDTPRKIFARKIKYWECRPLPGDEQAVVCSADSRMLLGQTCHLASLPIKNKFFDCAELLGGSRRGWADHFEGGCYALFRLTPEKYHYSHSPVTGIVEDFYAVEGRYHSCNPNAVVQLLHPYSKNRRVVTILRTDTEEGSGVGLVAMVEVVALMVGQMEQCYSEFRYDNPRLVQKGMRLLRGAPKAVFLPGSSTIILLFQRGRIHFADDLLRNQRRRDVRSCYSTSFGQMLVETDVMVRSPLATSANRCLS
jgi:phosphatidylserine decarboxylase